MNIIVCIKQVIDPEVPPVTFKVDRSQKKVIQSTGVSLVVDPYSEYALEAALQIKDKHGGKVTALSLGTKLLKEVIRKPLSLGADEFILLEDETFEGGDSWSNGYALAKAIEKIGDYNIIFCGRESADWSSGQVGSAIAEVLSLPSVTVGQKITLNNDKLIVAKRTDSGHEVIEVALPAVITISHEVGPLRYQTIKGIMAAKRKEWTVWKADDIGVDPAMIGAAGRRTELVDLVQPLREGRCEFIQGESDVDGGVNLAIKLRAEGIL